MATREVVFIDRGEIELLLEIQDQIPESLRGHHILGTVSQNERGNCVASCLHWDGQKWVGAIIPIPSLTPFIRRNGRKWEVNWSAMRRLVVTWDK